MMPSSNVGGGSESFMSCVRPATCRSVAPRAGLGSLVLALVVISGLAAAQTPPAAGGDITGVIKSGSMPLPGVTVSAANSLTGQKAVTSTAEDGSYALHLSANGRYVVRAEMAAFAAATHEVVINAENHSARVDLDLTLLSRVQQQRQQAAAQARRRQAALTAVSKACRRCSRNLALAPVTEVLTMVKLRPPACKCRACRRNRRRNPSPSPATPPMPTGRA